MVSKNTVKRRNKNSLRADLNKFVKVTEVIMSSSSLILSSTIKPSDSIPFLELKSVEERIKQYLKALIFYITETEIENIIFCDNSNFSDGLNLISEVGYNLSLAFGKKFEILSFPMSKESVMFGKGYGEGEIIKFVLDNSQLIKETRTFYKVTGRLIVKNINLLNKLTNYEIAFQKQGKDSVDTRFFKVSINFYKEHLIECYKEVNDKEGLYLEKIFYKKLKNLSIPSFPVYPLIVGQSGSTGIYYNDKFIKAFLKNILNKLGYYKL